jgi:uncharacterized membrane protein
MKVKLFNSVWQLPPMVKFAFLALCGFALQCWAYYPGFMSPDTIDQYRQALAHSYSDWHPPIMAGFWSLFTPFFKGGAPMFLLQLLALWTSFFILLLLYYERFRRYMYLLAILFFAPFVFNFAGNIWKDVQMAFSWLLAVAIMIKALMDKRTPSLAESALCFVLLCYGCWVRANALTGLIPLVGMWVIYIKKDKTQSEKTWRLCLKTMGYTAVVVILQMCITRFILKPERTFPESKLFLHDISGIYKASGKLYFPGFVLQHPGFDSLYIKEKFNYATFDNIWWNSDGKNIVPPIQEKEIKILRESWLKAIKENPFIYVKNRWRGFLNFLRFTDSGSDIWVMYPYIHPNELGFEFKERRITRFITDLINKQKNMFYMKPWFWLLLNIIVIVVAHKGTFAKTKLSALFLGYSSVLYLLPQFFIFQTDTDFRYLYWNCIAVGLAFILLFSERLQSRLLKQAAPGT